MTDRERESAKTLDEMSRDELIQQLKYVTKRHDDLLDESVKQFDQIQELQATVRRLEAENGELRGGPVGPYPNCGDCGRAMVWDGPAHRSWMCPHCVFERMRRVEAERDELRRRGDAESKFIIGLRTALLRIAGTRHDSDVYGAHEECWTLANKAIDALDDAEAQLARAALPSPENTDGE